MDIIDTFTVQAGLDEAFKFSDYMEPRIFVLILAILVIISIPPVIKAILRDEHGKIDIGSDGILTVFLFVICAPLGALQLFLMFNENPKITDEDRLTSEIISKTHDDYLSREIIRKVESEGWKLDCPKSSDSILCGGERLDTPVPVHKDNGERTHIAASFSYQHFFQNNGFNAVDVKLGNGVLKPGEPLTVTVELEKVAKESEQPAQLTLNPFAG